MPPTPATSSNFASESEREASLHGHRALTPLIAGTISGGLVGVAWIIGFIIYFYKRHRRELRARRLGYRSHREMLDPPKKEETFIIPPDPAIVEGECEPGARLYEDPTLQGNEDPLHARTEAIAQTEHSNSGSGLSTTKQDGDRLEAIPVIRHPNSAPSSLALLTPPTELRSSNSYQRISSESEGHS
ncbi:hypothetical protein BDY19DRAFT_951661 [Irpex rosettiformis]|uniref:Uncharacterized protein n=1 Tax=Irpex rosettiformis TaxID=378272 RepID=A0ACB8U221_9APHY|nr:hypothetical protein BDY19DRAFT_951661 [Irpex rosettiformis]